MGSGLVSCNTVVVCKWAVSVGACVVAHVPRVGTQCVNTWGILCTVLHCVTVSLSAVIASGCVWGGTYSVHFAGCSAKPRADRCCPNVCSVAVITDSGPVM